MEQERNIKLIRTYVHKQFERTQTKTKEIHSNSNVGEFERIRTTKSKQRSNKISFLCEKSDSFIDNAWYYEKFLEN